MKDEDLSVRFVSDYAGRPVQLSSVAAREYVGDVAGDDDFVDGEPDVEPDSTPV